MVENIVGKGEINQCLHFLLLHGVSKVSFPVSLGGKRVKGRRKIMESIILMHFHTIPSFNPFPNDKF